MNIRTAWAVVASFGLFNVSVVASGYAQEDASVAVGSYPARLADTDGKRLLAVLATHHIHTNTFGSHIRVFVLVPSREATEARQFVSKLIEEERLSLKVYPRGTPPA